MRPPDPYHAVGEGVAAIIAGVAGVAMYGLSIALIETSGTSTL